MLFYSLEPMKLVKAKDNFVMFLNLGLSIAIFKTNFAYKKSVFGT